MLHLRDLGAKRASVAAGLAYLCDTKAKFGAKRATIAAGTADLSDLSRTMAILRAKRATIAAGTADLSNTEAKLRANRAAVAAGLAHLGDALLTRKNVTNMASVKALFDNLLVAAVQAFFAENHLSVEIRHFNSLVAQHCRLVDVVVAMRVANWHAREESLDIGVRALSKKFLVVRRVVLVSVAQSLLSNDSTVLTTVAAVAAKTQRTFLLTERFLGDTDQVVESAEEFGSRNSASHASRSKLSHFCSLFLTKDFKVN